MTEEGRDGRSGSSGSGALLDARLLRASVASRLFGASATPVSVGPYLLLKQIGAGGMGLVFEARDSRTNHRLAVKVLRRRGAAEFALLKREFRALADIHHPNLVQLYELSTEDEAPFIAMELIEGCSLLQYVRQDGALDIGRLRHTLGQLVEAISTLHASSVLHRDVKPSNVLVQPDRRLVVLDFGLALAAGEQRAGLLAGTPRYMAPERLQGRPASEASDWYSVGMMLREAIFGDLAPPSRRLTADEAELAQICEQLMQPDPMRRPTAEQLRAVLGLSERPRASSPVRPVGSAAPFVGRDDEQRRLQEAFALAATGRCVQVHVCGEPGIGKTALARRFIQMLRAEHDVTVLTGRCYERELIPFNAVDGFAEALGDELEQVPSPDRSRVQGLAELSRLFPSLLAVRPPGANANGEPEPVHQDLHMVRRRAFVALRSLLQLLAARRPLVVHLDDLQWGDADSAGLLHELLQPPAPAPMLLIAGYRSGGAESSVCVRALRELDRGDLHRAEIRLGPLANEAALTLARSLANEWTTDAELRALSAEAAGNPLFLRALIEHLAQYASRGPNTSHPTFQDVVHAAIQQLPQAGQELLQLVALSPRPLERDLLLHAAEGAAPDPVWPEQLAALQRSGLLRSVPGRRSAVESYHDRMRETVAAAIDPELKRRHHARLAAAVTSTPEPDPEFLAYHYEGAGELTAAARHAELAGDRAFATAALEPAAKLYEAALRCLQGQRPVPLLDKLANAIAYSGRCAQAAPLYLEAAGAAPVEQALQLRLRAAEMLLRSGRLRESAEVAKPVLRAVGIRYPASTFGALASVAANMLHLRMLDLDAELKGRTPTSIEQLRVEVCFVLGYRLGISDPVRACSLLVRSLLLALQSGTDAQVARAFACYALLLSLLAKAPIAEQDRLLDRAWELACHVDDPDTKGWVLFLRSVTVYARGSFREALTWIDRARSWIAAHCVDTGWLLQELDVGRSGQLFLTGQIALLADTSPLTLRRILDTGNEHLAECIRAHSCIVSVARDRSEDALHELDNLLSGWDRSEFNVLISTTLWLKMHVLLYRGETSTAWRFLREHWPCFAKAGYQRVQPWNVGLPLVEATAALACAQHDPSRVYLRALRSCLGQLRRIGSTWGPPARLLIAGGLSHLQGQHAAAAESYAAAAHGFEALGMDNYANAARVRLADLLSESEAAPLRARAEAWFREQGIAQPERWVGMYAPVARARC